MLFDLLTECTTRHASFYTIDRILNFNDVQLLSFVYAIKLHFTLCHWVLFYCMHYTTCFSRYSTLDFGRGQCGRHLNKYRSQVGPHAREGIVGNYLTLICWTTFLGRIKQIMLQPVSQSQESWTGRVSRWTSIGLTKEVAWNPSRFLFLGWLYKHPPNCFLRKTTPKEYINQSGTLILLVENLDRTGRAHSWGIADNYLTLSKSWTTPPSIPYSTTFLEEGLNKRSNQCHKAKRAALDVSRWSIIDKWASQKKLYSIVPLNSFCVIRSVAKNQKPARS